MGDIVGYIGMYRTSQKRGIFKGVYMGHIGVI